jgi:glycerol-3-phosphate dehydrogenase
MAQRLAESPQPIAPPADRLVQPPSVATSAARPATPRVAAEPGTRAASAARPRKDRLADLRARPDVSVLIVGGGINGAGVFRELALQGVDVVLVERGDFCSGCSATSGRVAHGGLRYLENREIRLVRESLRERDRLLRNAPHAVRPLRATVPLFGWVSGLATATRQFLGIENHPGDRGAIVVEIGLTLYDLLALRHRVLPRHRFRRHSGWRAPLAIERRVVGFSTYWDARLTSAERICLEVLADGETENSNALALNYVEAVGQADGTVMLRDLDGGSTIEVRPRVLVNAAGPWIDRANEALGVTTGLIGGTKGSHIVVNHPDLWTAIGGEMLHFANTDGRLTIICPLEDRVLIGTTDIPIDDPDSATWTEDEVDYLLAAPRQIFPDLELDRSHIVFRFCGVRPLPAVDSSSPASITRDHRHPVEPATAERPFPIISLVGGKWTTFRAFGEVVTDEVLQILGRQRRAWSRRRPIGGGVGYPCNASERDAWIATVSERTGIAPDRTQRLLERYGTWAGAVCTYLASGPDSPLATLPDFSTREIGYLASQESVVHLDDIVLRRSMLAMLGRLTDQALREVAEAAGEALAWPVDRVDREVERTKRTLRERHGAVLSG